MNITYQSTRGGERGLTASQAILKGLAVDGGLFMPDQIPQLDVSMGQLAKMSYQEIAYEVMKLFLTDFTEEELKGCIARAYDEKFDCPEIAVLSKADGDYYLELYHGSTIAFKDMALSILPHLMTTAAKKNGVSNEIVILAATSGDTGKAAMAGFADVPGTRIIVFYPKGGVSRIQELQMVTQKGDNTAVVAIHGNFDDAQTGVKKIFGDREFEKRLAAKGFQLSSANSINVGRLVPQIAYYVYAYAKLLENGEIADGELVNVTVPTGNFGNILAGYYARQMGVPIKTLICASNQNNVLTDFIRTGIYDRNRPFYHTTSPSMDILVSSNLERLIFELSGREDGLVRGYMEQLADSGRYQVSAQLHKKIQELFAAGCCDDGQASRTIERVWRQFDYLIDPHTAVAFHVLEEYRASTGDDTPAVVVSTASPFKFCTSVLSALGVEEHRPGTEALDQLAQHTGVPIPTPLAALKGKARRFDAVTERDGMREQVLEFLR